MRHAIRLRRRYITRLQCFKYQPKTLHNFSLDFYVFIPQMANLLYFLPKSLQGKKLL